jgi:hypothetical protein
MYKREHYFDGVLISLAKIARDTATDKECLPRVVKITPGTGQKQPVYKHLYLKIYISRCSNYSTNVLIYKSF